MRNTAFFLLFSLLILPCAATAGIDPAQDRSVAKLVGSMDANEQDYYYSAFSYSMATLKTNQQYNWASYNSKGAFVAGKPFRHDGSICRTFTETVANPKLYTASAAGIGCKRVGAEGWCKLKKDDVPTCALEPASHGIMDSPFMPDAVGNAVNNAEQEIKGIHAPALPDMPGIPDMPSMPDWSISTVTGTSPGSGSDQDSGSQQKSSGSQSSPGASGVRDKVNEIGSDIGSTWSRWTTWR